MKINLSPWRPVRQLLAALLLTGPLAGPAPAQAFTPVATYASGGLQPYGLAVGDVSDDGRPNLLTLTASSYTVAVLLGSATSPAPVLAPAATKVAR